MAVMDNAVKKGYTFAWGSDVSEQGFSRDGIAVMPDAAKESELSGSDMARWTGLTAADKRRELFTKPFPEKRYHPGNASDCFRQLGNNR